MLMGLDFYKVLQVDGGTKDNGLKKAYRKLAMTKTLTPRNKPKAKFKHISEAYEVYNPPHFQSQLTHFFTQTYHCLYSQVLSVPQKRAVYDQYGEERLQVCRWIFRHVGRTYKFNPQSEGEGGGEGRVCFSK